MISLIKHNRHHYTKEKCNEQNNKVSSPMTPD